MTFSFAFDNIKGMQFLYGDHSVIKVTGGGGSRLRLLPRAVQQIKVLPRAHTTSHFWRPRAIYTLQFYNLRLCIHGEASGGHKISF